MTYLNFFGRKVKAKDVVNRGGQSLEAFQYSTSEKWTGEYWIDNKKIYQRTWLVGEYTTRTNATLEVSNIDNIWFDMGNSFYIERSSAGSGNIWPINGNLGDENENGFTVSGRGPYFDGKRINWTVSNGGCKSACITFRYTKLVE